MHPGLSVKPTRPRSVVVNSIMSNFCPEVATFPLISDQREHDITITVNVICKKKSADAPSCVRFW